MAWISLDGGRKISLVYTEHVLALGTAFPPDGQWLRKMAADSTRISPCPKKETPRRARGLDSLHTKVQEFLLLFPVASRI